MSPIGPHPHIERDERRPVQTHRPSGRWPSLQVPWLERRAKCEPIALPLRFRSHALGRGGLPPLPSVSVSSPFGIRRAHRSGGIGLSAHDRKIFIDQRFWHDARMSARRAYFWHDARVSARRAQRSHDEWRTTSRVWCRAHDAWRTTSRVFPGVLDPVCSPCSDLRGELPGVMPPCRKSFLPIVASPGRADTGVSGPLLHSAAISCGRERGRGRAPASPRQSRPRSSCPRLAGHSPV